MSGGGPRGPVFRGRVRPPTRADVDNWLRGVPLWERNQNYPWSASCRPSPAGTTSFREAGRRGQQRGGETSGASAREAPVVRPPVRRVPPPSRPEPPAATSSDDWELQPIGQLRQHFARQESSRPTPTPTGPSALPPRKQPTKRKSSTIANGGGGCIEVIDLSKAPKRKQNSRTSGGFDMASLFSTPTKEALPTFVVDLSARSSLAAFREALNQEDAGVIFTLLLSSKGYGCGSSPSTKWRKAAEHFTPNLVLTKEQKKSLKVKLGTAVQQMDPDGHVVGLCFMATRKDKAHAQAPALQVHFLPLTEEKDASIQFSGEVPRAERAQFVRDFLGSKKHKAQCFDLQGILRRVSRTQSNQSEALASAVDSKSNFLCLKLLSWLLEPGLAHDKVIDGYSLTEVAAHYRLDWSAPSPHHSGADGIFSAILCELKLTDALGSSLEARLRRQPLAHLPTILGIEMEVAGLLAQMEVQGISYNLSLMRELKSGLEARLERIDAEAHGIAGEAFNLRSQPQLAGTLYDKLRAPQKNKSRTTDEQRLRALQGSAGDVRVSRLAALVLEYRRLSQIISKWIDADWLENARLIQGPRSQGSEDRLNVCCSWNQTSTATGRLSASNPNLQAVTKYVINDLGDGGSDPISIRNAFVSRPGTVLLSLDYSQIEIRLLAHLSKDQELCRILRERSREKSDLFATLATLLRSKVRIPPGGGSSKTSERDQAKRTAYSIIYGTSAMGLGQQLGIPIATAQSLKKSFLSVFQGVSKFISAVKASARENGYVETLLQRRRYLQEIRSAVRAEREAAERKAVNTTVQGSAADLIKISMVRFLRMKTGNQVASARDVRLVAQIHDEVLLEVRDDPQVIREAGRVMERIMCTGLTLSVPIEVNVQVGKRWGEMKDLCLD